MQSRNRQSGFTLVELLVAVALTALIIGFVNQLLNSTTTAVSRGVQFGDIIANNRAISERLFEDGQGMVAPQPATAEGNPAGMLVIFGREITRPGAGVFMPDPLNADPSGRFFAPGVRSDQLMFIKENENPVVETLAPVSDTSFAGKRQHAASYSKVWWGHLQRTKADPTAGPSTTLDDPSPDGENYAGWGWILGRQELFLTDPTPTPPPVPLPVFGVPPVHVAGVAWDSPVAAPPAYFPGTIPVAQQVNWGGFSDVSEHPLDNAGRSAVDPQALIAETTADGLFFDGMPDAVYRQQAYNMLFPEERLRVNDHPAAPYEAWRIAQMYPYVSQGVSDFIVEFAADANADGQIDVDYTAPAPLLYDNKPDPLPVPPGSNEPRIVWYSSQPAFQPATAPFDFSAYAAFPNLPAAGAGDPMAAGPAGSNADVVFTWRHDFPDNWPYLIRIRYRVHDTRGEVRTAQDDGLGTFTYTGNDIAQAGRWFEVILPVARTPDRNP